MLRSCCSFSRVNSGEETKVSNVSTVPSCKKPMPPIWSPWCVPLVSEIKVVECPNLPTFLYILRIVGTLKV